ncbi:MAG: adenylate/guanylate cyclase domain-containing protein [Firmicutes bacterium]|nr:adenylate/guanylate cyclase domain-containing protein [Bacillota bacterium]
MRRFLTDSRRGGLILAALIAFLVILVSRTGLFLDLERRGYDYRTVFSSTEPGVSPVVLVGVSDQTLRELGRWPFDRSIHAQMVQKLAEAGARVIGLDILLTETASPEGDQALAEAVAGAGNVIMAGYGELDKVHSQPGLIRPLSFTRPLPAFEGSGRARVAHINVSVDEDGFVRYVPLLLGLDGGPLPALSLQAVSLYMKGEAVSWDGEEQVLRLGRTPLPTDRFGRAAIPFLGGAGMIPSYPYHDVLAGRVPMENFQGRIVLVGPTAVGLGDFYWVPPSIADGQPMYGMEIHAQAIYQILARRLLSFTPWWVEAAAIILLALAVWWIGQRFRAMPAFFLSLAAAFLYIGLSAFIFESARLVTPLVHPLLALGGTYLGQAVLRYVTEEREKARVTRLFGKYVPPQVVGELLKNPDLMKLGGRRQEATLLFADVRGFTPFAEARPPEEVMDLLNRYLAAMTDVIFEEEGTLDKFVGDQVMAVFNAPLPQPDHALRGVRAAIRIQERVTALQEHTAREKGVTLTVGIGVNTGDVVVGNVGTLDRMEYTAIGNNVNMAARLEASATSGVVLISEATYQRVAEWLEAEKVENLTVKGIAKPITAYRALRLHEPPRVPAS